MHSLQSFAQYFGSYSAARTGLYVGLSAKGAESINGLPLGLNISLGFAVHKTFELVEKILINDPKGTNDPLRVLAGMSICALTYAHIPEIEDIYQRCTLSILTGFTSYKIINYNAQNTTLIQKNKNAWLQSFYVLAKTTCEMRFTDKLSRLFESTALSGLDSDVKTEYVKAMTYVTISAYALTDVVFPIIQSLASYCKSPQPSQESPQPRS